MGLLTTAWCGVLLSGCAASGGAASDAHVNANHTRWATGVYTYRTIAEQTFRGMETWTLTVQPDGSRTMMAFVDNADRNVTHHMVHRVAADFRPMETFITHWMDGALRGSAHIVVDGGRLTSHVTGPGGRIVHTMAFPEGASVHPHPVATDGWRGYAYDASHGGAQQSMNYNVAVGPDAATPMLGRLEQESVEALGARTITVPAGTFETVGYRLRGSGEIWLMPRDRVVVLYAYPSLDREYVLTTYRAAPAGDLPPD